MLKEAVLWEKTDGREIRCVLCSHKCVIQDGSAGLCGMRENRSGQLFTYAYGELAAAGPDPVEKKPLYHFFPGTLAYSIAARGCNFRCSFCQNWNISQGSSRKGPDVGIELRPCEVVRKAIEAGCKSIAYTYTEPTIFFEYAFDIAGEARKNGLKNIFVTNGYMTNGAVELIAPSLDAANVDLKFFKDETYKKLCGARLAPVLDSITRTVEKGVWVEITTLVIPGENDSDKELRGIASFIAGLSTDIPWHISRFHPDYKLLDKYPTMPESLYRAKELGKKEGLKNIYTGNIISDNHTYCPGCGEKLIDRTGPSGCFVDNSVRDGKCAICGETIPGVWR